MKKVRNICSQRDGGVVDNSHTHTHSFQERGEEISSSHAHRADPKADHKTLDLDAQGTAT